MKRSQITHLLAAAGLLAGLLSSCTSVKRGPVHPPAPASGGGSAPKSGSGSGSGAQKTTTTTGALRQVPNDPKPEAPKPFPDIPLKEDTGSSPLIITQPDTKPYVRD